MDASNIGGTSGEGIEVSAVITGAVSDSNVSVLADTSGGKEGWSAVRGSGSIVEGSASEVGSAVEGSASGGISIAEGADSDSEAGSVVEGSASTVGASVREPSDDRSVVGFVMYSPVAGRVSPADVSFCIGKEDCSVSALPDSSSACAGKLPDIINRKTDKSNSFCRIFKDMHSIHRD